jgi:nucleoside-diphosphate-sugar epimerase
MRHRTPLPPDLAGAGCEVVQADLARPETLRSAVAGVHAIVHFAGVLFAPRPERFLPTTNTGWFSNLLDAAIEARVSRLVLISFPHVEGETSFDHPATGRLDRQPVSVHAQTRLAEERLLLERTRGSSTAPIVLRLGMVYGAGILMVDAARWLAARRLLGVWRPPTSIQLVSAADCARAIEAAILVPSASGIYHVGDEQPVTLQQFLTEACRAWGYPPPWRMPLWMIETAAGACELFARVAGTKSPLTRDFIRIGRVSYWGDTARMRRELLPTLTHPTLQDGIGTL